MKFLHPPAAAAAQSHEVSVPLWSADRWAQAQIQSGERRRRAVIGQSDINDNIIVIFVPHLLL